MHNYKNLHIWRDGIALVKKIYEVTGTFPDHEKYGIVSQMTRAAVSIPSNIAEGAGRNSAKDCANFLSIAVGSIFELHTQITICEEIGYIDNKTATQLNKQIFTLQQQITAYRQKLEGSAPRQGETSPTSGRLTAKRSYNEQSE